MGVVRSTLDVLLNSKKGASSCRKSRILPQGDFERTIQL